MASSLSRRERRRRIVLWRLAVAAAASALVLVGVGFAFAGSAAVLAEGATIAGVEVGGLSPAAAAGLLERRASALERRPVVFATGEGRMALAAFQLSVRADWTGAVQAASDEADGFGPIRGFRRLRLRLAGSDVAPAITASRSALAFAVAQLADTVDRGAVDASIVRRGRGFAIAGGRSGRALDREAARRVIAATLGSLERPGVVRLPVVEIPPDVTASDLRPELRRARTAVSGPVRLVHGPTRLVVRPAELATLLALPARGATDVSIGGRTAEEWFARVSARISRPPRDAGWAIGPDGDVRVTPGARGLRVDIPRTVERFAAAAFSPSDRTAAVSVRSEAPNRTTAEARAMGIAEVVSSYTTAYGGTPGRVHNVRLVAELVDGALVAPGATFSFNAVTGERNAEKGFEEAPVIINGELRNGIGGGVCQVSTTVFNAAFDAGLPIAERTNHALWISHYPLGRDATVNYPDLDLRFVNDTDRWLQVRTFVGPGALTVKLLGTSPRRRVETETAPLQVTGKMPFRAIRDPELVRGTRIVERIGTHPRQTSVRRLVYGADGGLLSDRTWTSFYVGEPTVVRIGTKPKEPERAPSPPAAGAADGDASAETPVAPVTTPAAAVPQS